MTLNEYQLRAFSTCMPSSSNPLYMLFNLQGEVGELCSKLAKLIRKDLVVYNGNRFDWTDNVATLSRREIDDIEQGLIAEMGDILWQIAGYITVSGYSLEEIAQCNLDKLASRKERGVIAGEGDNR